MQQPKLQAPGKGRQLKVHNAIQINVASPGEVISNIAQEYFEVPEAARIMRVSKRTLYRLISEEKLKSKKVLRRTLILKEDIKLFFAIQ